MTYVKRKTTDLNIETLGSIDNDTFIHETEVKNTRLVIKNLGTSDIGSLVYSKRKRKLNKNGTLSKSEVEVKQASLLPERGLALLNFIENLSVALATGTIRKASAYCKIRNLMSFVDWCDDQGHSRVFEDLKNAKEAIWYFSLNLEHLIRTNQLSPNTASTYQFDAILAVSCMLSLPVENVKSSVRRIYSDSNVAEKTSPPTENTVKKVIPLATSLLKGAYKLVIEKQKLPFLLKLPSEDVWILPTKPRWVATTEKLKIRESWAICSWAWDYESGTINSPDEIMNKYQRKSDLRSLHAAKQMIRQASRQLLASNSDERHFTRIQVAKWACNCFIILFAANTGMNYAQIRNLGWSEDNEIRNDIHGFKTIKYRALGRTTEFYITKSFLKLFKLYLSLRLYILQDTNFPYLFFSVQKSVIKQIPQGKIRQIFRDLSRIFYDDIDLISSREWRAYKANYLTKNTDVSTTALILQNTEETVLRSYTEGNDSDSRNELSKFFNSISEKIYTDPEKKAQQANSPVGHCSSANNPTRLLATDGIIPDCKTPEGCLFCEHYALHALCVNLNPYTGSMS